MFRECMESIRHDRVRAFFYWLTFVLTVMYVFVFFAVTASDYYGFSMLHAKADLSAALMALSLIVCSVEIFFANDFFVRSKSKDLAVRMICGASFGKNALFLGGQALILMAAALPPGVLLGMMMIPVINAGFSGMLTAAFHASVSAEAVFWIAGVLCYVIFWTLILNLSYAYRNTPVQMLYPQKFRRSASMFKIGAGTMQGRMAKILHLLMFVLPLLYLYVKRDAEGMLLDFSDLFYTVQENETSELLKEMLGKADPYFFLCVFVSLYGLMHCLFDYAVPLITARIRRGIRQPHTSAALGFVRSDLGIVHTGLILTAGVFSLLVYFLLTADHPEHRMLIIISFASLSVFLSSSMMFRYLDAVSSRTGQFRILSKIGFDEEGMKKIVKSEVIHLFLLVVLLILLYAGNVFCVLLVQGDAVTPYTVVLTAVWGTVPAGICALISYRYYRKIVIGGII